MEFPGNSHNPLGDTPKKDKDQVKKEISKVVAVNAVIKKKPIHKRFKETFFGGDAKTASKFVFTDVLLPALKNLVVDAGNTMLNRMMYGDSPRRRFGNEPSRSRFSYNNPVMRSSERVMLPDQPPRMINRSSPVGEIVLTTRDDAENVLEGLVNIIEKYEVASVADLYELVGLPSAHTDNKWGWSHLKYANVRQIRDGYLIELPQPEPI